MSLSSALNNAFSGLKANSRAAGLVSTNIANATTESYGKRELVLNAGLTGGVRVDGVSRNVDSALIADRRFSDAQTAASNDLLNFIKKVEDVVGVSGEAGSFVGRVEAFENSLLTAASNPASTQRLEMVATTANDLALTLNTMSDKIQTLRTDADRTIGAQIDLMNETLARLDEINVDVVKGRVSGVDTASLLDERNRLLDGISDIVPLRVVEQDKGSITVYTTGGALLLDSKPAEIEFERSIAVRVGDTVANGALSGLTFNGVAVSTSDNGMFGGGSLAAQFNIRDNEGVQRQAELDGIARDLVERLGPGGPDMTLGATDPGLFTDIGLAFDPLNEEGLASRISLNSLVAPGSGGSWRLRDGLGAATQGEVGEARLLQGISAAMSASNVPSSTTLASVSRSFVDHASEFASTVSGSRVRAELSQSYQSSRNTALKEAELAKGVDTDFELQRLMQIEQLYTANAKVMSTVDELLQRLLQI
ncbi:flagellar hook-associated protein FlgK [Tropicibacter naphthalenivorans]|uniref:Flagellar hook-associated protein 1 n=1 Tax=Tropicibacter naphthalenivorans TaxID=441103 RepID=A0A0P1GVN2_9RHOB|nr:flagellar hook-associated protein FlgK [Tropicibacter naphthalenivorans]CUH79688.1 flagellar hook-associated protein FlgK [Tropicibacter naphthalenivorans]SMC74465.1 flagellar hook-associated protein 1 FlgK [Tropicibacter naphthalenivorans]